MNIRTIFFYLICMMILPMHTLGAVYYIDSDVDDTPGGKGTLANPYTSVSSLPAETSVDIYVHNISPMKGTLDVPDGASGSPTRVSGYEWIDFEEVGIISTGDVDTHGLNAFERGGKTYVAVGCKYAGLKIYDVTIPSDPELKFVYDDNPNIAAFHGDTAYNSTSDCLYSAGREGGLYIFDCSNPSTGHDLANGNMDDIDMVNRIPSPGNEKVTGLCLDSSESGTLYVANRRRGLFRVQNAISNPTGCSADLSYQDTFCREVHRINKTGSYLYAPASSGLTIYDVSGALTKLSKIWTWNETWDVAVRGSYLYVTTFTKAEETSDARYQPGLLIYDISDKNSPLLVGSWKDYSNDYTRLAPYDPPAYDFVLCGNYAVIALGIFGTQIIDVSNPYQPSQAFFIPVPSGISSHEYFGSWGVDACGDKIYVIYKDIDQPSVTIMIYQIIPEIMNVSFKANGSRILHNWHQKDKTDNEVDDDFRHATISYHDGNRVWQGEDRAAGSTIEAREGTLFFTAPKGLNYPRMQLVRTIQDSPSYNLHFKMKLKNPPVLEDAYFYINLLEYESYPLRIQRLFIIGQAMVGNKYRIILRYSYDDSNYGSSSWIQDLDYGTEYSVQIAYKIDSGSGGDTWRISVVGGDDVHAESGNSDTTGVTQRPNMIKFGPYGTPTTSAGWDFEVSEFHYNSGEDVDIFGDDNIWITDLPSNDNPKILFVNGVKGKEVDSPSELDADNEWYFENDDISKVWLYLDSKSPDVYLNFPRIEAGFDSSSLKFSLNRDFMEIMNVEQYGSRNNGILIEDDFDNSVIKYSIIRENGSNGIYYSASGPGCIYNCTIYGNNANGLTLFLNPNAELTLANCIIAMNGEYQIDAEIDDTAIFTHKNNVLWDGTYEDISGLSLHESEYGADPELKAPERNDYHLTATSSGRDNGTDSVYSKKEYDFDGDQITGDDGASLGEMPIGALSYQSNSYENSLWWWLRWRLFMRYPWLWNTN